MLERLREDSTRSPEPGPLPATQIVLVDAFVKAALIQQGSSPFDIGTRYAYKHHAILIRYLIVFQNHIKSSVHVLLDLWIRAGHNARRPIQHGLETGTPSIVTKTGAIISRSHSSRHVFPTLSPSLTLAVAYLEMLLHPLRCLTHSPEFRMSSNLSFFCHRF